MMVRNKFSFNWYSYFRCNMVDEETIDLMKESGCGGVFLGIESGDANVLKNMKKKAKVEHYRRALKLLNDAGILSFASLIVGFPGETEDSVHRTIELINEIKPTFFHGEIWYYNHRSPIYKERYHFDLKGQGYNWQHSTMDWSIACDLVEELFMKVKNSIWLPMYDLDFWIIPYLLGKGMSLDFIQHFIRLCNELLALKFNQNAISTERLIIEKQIEELCHNFKNIS